MTDDDHELKELKREMEALAHHLLRLDTEIETDTVAMVLKALLNGESAASVIDDYGLEDSDGG